MNKISKLFLLLSAVSLVLWLGSYTARFLSVFYLFQPETLIIKDEFIGEALTGALKIIFPIISMNAFVFPLFLIFFLIYLVTSKINLKSNGWLFIILLIVIITSPFEIYLLTYDYDYITRILSGGFTNDELLSILVRRIKVLSSFPIIEIFSYFTVVYLFLFKPFKK